jgi:hypothetical protein
VAKQHRDHVIGNQRYSGLYSDLGDFAIVIKACAA